MGDSDREWGGLAAHDSGMADAWDRCNPLPDPGDAPELDAFCKTKHVTIPDLVRVGARLSPGDGLILAFAGDQGLKFRDVRTGKRWSYAGSEWTTFHVVKHATGDETDTLIVVEGETDAARVSSLYPGCDVGIQQAGAEAVMPGFATQAQPYSRVLVALDRDEAGEKGWVKWKELTQAAIRFPAPDGMNDWCEWDGADPPDLPDPPPQLPVIVSARELLKLEPPDVVSWFEHAVLPVGGLMVVHGWVKSFKSFLAFDILSALAQGKDWMGFEPAEEPCNVLCLQYEIPWPFYQRRVAAMRRHALHPERFEERYFTWDPLRRPKLTAGDRTTEDELLREIEANSVQVMLVDPIRRLVRGVRAKDRDFEQEARVALGFFERVQDLGVTVVTTHHDNKQAAKTGGGDPIGITGAGAWSGDADTIVSIALPHGDDYGSSLRRNVHFTFRNSSPIGARGFELETGAEDEDSRLVYSPDPFSEEPAEESGPSQPAI